MDKLREQNWRELCQAAATEQDPNKLIALVAELNKVLDEQHRNHETAAGNKKNCGGSSFPTLYAA